MFWSSTFSHRSTKYHIEKIIIFSNLNELYLSKIGLSEVRRAVMPPVAPSAKKKNMPARSFGWRSFAFAFSSYIITFQLSNIKVSQDNWNELLLPIIINVLPSWIKIFMWILLLIYYISKSMPWVNFQINIFIKKKNSYI
jgi:hypothetical protein